MTKRAAIHSLSPATRPEIALREAAQALATICAMIDDEKLDPRSATVKALFKDAAGGLAISVDGAIDFKRSLAQEVAKANLVIKFWRSRKKMIKEMRDAFDQKLIETMTDYPEQPYTGAVEGFQVKTNPPAVDLAWGDAKLTEKIIDDHAIALEYVRPKTSFEIDKVAVAAALKRGVKIPWARLSQAKRVETK